MVVEGKKNFNKKYSISIIVILTIVILIGLYFIQYPVKTDKSSLEVELRKYQENKDIKIQKVEIMDNKIIALYTDHDGIGYGTFIKGINGRCLLVSSHRNSGGAGFLQGYIETNKGNYSIFAGRNYDNRIKVIQFLSEDGNKFISDISKESYFFIKLHNTKGAFSFLKFDLLDDRGDSIKEEIIKKYSGNNSSSSVKAKMELGLYNFWYVLTLLISSILIYSKYHSTQHYM
jgi:hypothetical protein